MASYIGKNIGIVTAYKGLLRISFNTITFPYRSPTTSVPVDISFTGYYFTILFASNAVELSKHYLHSAWSPDINAQVFWESNKVNMFPVAVIPSADVANLVDKAVWFSDGL